MSLKKKPQHKEEESDKKQFKTYREKLASLSNEEAIEDFLANLANHKNSKDTIIAEFDAYYFENLPRFYKEYIMKLFYVSLYFLTLAGWPAQEIRNTALRWQDKARSDRFNVKSEPFDKTVGLPEKP